MNNDEIWTILASLLPNGAEVFPDEDKAVIEFENKKLNIYYNDINSSFVVNGKTLYFQDGNFEVIGTMLVPYILQELDGNRRI